jgi:hypothetical protein
MGELNERRWSVMSERGLEAAGLVYTDAAALMRRLLGEKIYGTCVVTDEAASRLGVAGDAPQQLNVAAAARNNGTPRDNGAAPAKKRRAPRRKRADAKTAD